MSGALTSLLGGLLRGQGSEINIMHGMIDNLSRCDVKRDGLCCYFPGICDPIARCISEPSPSNVFELGQSIPKCVCPEGFEGDGRSKGTGCKNIDECSMGLAQCEQLCTDLIPGYQCQCRNGFRLNQDGRTCRDINECTERQHNCSQTCTNTHGSFKCGCQKGYKLDPIDLTSCLEVNECDEAIITGVSVCQFDSLCVNLPGTYQCGCPPGLEPMESDPRQCVDRDECLTMERPCPMSHVIIDGREVESQMCENLFGGWSCLCLPGSRLRHEVETLSVIDERDALMYSAEDITWRFQRAQKLALQVQCDDINECQETPGICLPDQRHTNSAREFGDARAGDGIDELAREGDDEGMKLSVNGPLRDGDGPVSDGDGRRRDADSMRRDGAGLSVLAICENSFRGYSCGCPVEGLFYDRESRECIDLNECALGLCGKDPLMKCTNLEPGFECECEAGFLKKETKSSGLICVDINECQQDLSPCPPGSQCINTSGSFRCLCEPGYEAIHHELVDGTTALYKCADIDECALGMCPGPCMNIPGSFYCGCPRGFAAVNHELPHIQHQWKEMVAEAAMASSWTDKTFKAFSTTIAECVDIDECALIDAEVCGAECKCINLEGSYECDSSNGLDKASLMDNHQHLMVVSQRISLHLSELPLLALMPHLRADEFFLGLVGVENGAPLWRLSQIDWLRSGGFRIPEITSENVSRLFLSASSRQEALESIVEVFGDILLQSDQISCRHRRKCLDKSERVCTKVNAPCCRDLEHGAYECLPGKYRITSRRPICPLDTVDRLTE